MRLSVLSLHCELNLLANMTAMRPMGQKVKRHASIEKMSAPTAPPVYFLCGTIGYVTTGVWGWVTMTVLVDDWSRC